MSFRANNSNKWLENLYVLRKILVATFQIFPCFHEERILFPIKMCDLYVNTYKSAIYQAVIKYMQNVIF